MASLKYPTSAAIIHKSNKILKYYFAESKQEVNDRVCHAWQFLFLKTFRSIPEYSNVLQNIEKKVYKDSTTTRRWIVELANWLHYEYNNDHKLLWLKYINQLIDRTSFSTSIAKEEIHREYILKYVYESVMKLKTKLNSEIEDTHLLNLYWAKFIASIGIGKTFVSEGTYLKPRTTNKLTPLELKEDELRKDTKYLEWINNTWEYDEEIKINREEAVTIGARIHLRLIAFIMTTSNPLKPYLYSWWRLEYEILRMIKTDKASVKDSIQSNLKLFKIDESNREEIFQLLHKFSDDSAVIIEGNPTYKNDSLGKFWSNLVTHIENEEFKSIFSSLNWLMKEEDVFILNLLMPYVLYYSIRFSDHTSALIDQIAEYFNEVLEEGKETHVNILFNCLDFLNVWTIQDKTSFKKYIDQETKYKYVEKFFQLDPMKNMDIGSNIKTFLEKLNDNKTVERSFYFVKKTKSLMNKISKQSKMRAAKRTKQFKRYTIYFEEEVRHKIAKDSTMKGTFETDGFFEILGEEDVIDIVDVYKKLSPEDFDSKLFDSILDHWRRPKIEIKQDYEDSTQKQNYSSNDNANQSTWSQSSFWSQNESYTQLFGDENYK